MLSRTASNLYWTARYLERAESTARLLDACFQPGMPFNGDISKLYALPLQIQGCYEEFSVLNGGKKLTIESVSQYLIMGNSSAAVKSCLEIARENARSERSRLSSEVWEAVNQTWLEFQEWQYRPLHAFTEWLRQRAFIFQGVLTTTMPENLSLDFLRLGAFLERADQTLRVLEAKVVLQNLSGQSDYYLWHMLLRSVSSLEAYQETFVEVPSQERVLKFLLFNKSIPRSVRYCLERIQQLLEIIRAENRRPSLKCSAKLLVKLRYDELSEIAAQGQDIYIQKLQDDISSLAEAVHEGYFVIK